MQRNIEGSWPPMSIKGKAYIAGIYEHPTRLAKDISLAQIHAQVAKGALEDAGSPRTTSTATSAPATRPAWGRCRWSSTWG
jgi:hypothetical protein